jgi:hypothetical protein
MAQYDGIEATSDERVYGVGWAAHDRLVGVVERGVEHDWQAGELLVSVDQHPELRIVGPVDGLDPRGSVDVDDGRNRLAYTGSHLGGREHEWVDPLAGRVQVEVLVCGLIEDGGREGPEQLAPFDEGVDPVDGGGVGGRARMLRAPSARGPNSIWPWNQPMMRFCCRW